MDGFRTLPLAQRSPVFNPNQSSGPCFHETAALTPGGNSHPEQHGGQTPQPLPLRRGHERGVTVTNRQLFATLWTLTWFVAGCHRTVSAPMDAAPPDISIDSVTFDASEIEVVETMSISGSTGCRLDDGSVICWGSNLGGTLGLDRDLVDHGINRVSLPTSAIYVSAGLGFAAAITSDHTMWWWGRPPEPNAVSMQHPWIPRRVPGLPPVRQVSGINQVCVLTVAGEVWCGGEGAGVDQPRYPPRYVPELTHVDGVRGASRVAPGSSFALALMEDGSVLCWGNTQRGQCGQAGSDLTTRPVVVRGLPPAVFIAAGESSACAVARDHSLWCWGANDHGQLADGTFQDRTTPVRASVTDVVSVELGASKCALRSDGAVWCWGRRDSGLLGDGIRSDDARPTAAPVPGANDAIELAVGSEYACIRHTDHSIACWGDMRNGRVPGVSAVYHPLPTTLSLTP